MRGGQCVAAMVVAVLSRPALAPAQPRDFEAQHARGNALRAEHRDAEALEVFRGLWTRTHEPRARARMALAEAALGRWVDADAHLTEAIGDGSDAWVRQNRAALDEQRRLIANHVGRLDVRCNAPDAELWITGSRIATLPSEQPVRVVAGQVTFELRARGYETVQRTVLVDPGDEPTRAQIALARSGGEREERGRSAGVPALAVLGIVSTVGAAAGIGVGIAGLVVRNDHVATFRDHGCLLQPNADVVQSPVSGCRNEYSLGTTWETVSLASFVAGGVLAVAGVVMLVAAPSRRREERAGFACGVGPGSVGVACEGRF